MNLKIYTNIKVYLLYLISLKNRKFINFLMKNMKFSKSQVYQDLFIIYFSKLKKNGKFIEIGGGNGVDLSNTYLHEKKYKWKGVICEPDNRSHANIKKYRNAKLEKQAISDICKKNTSFYQSQDPYLSSLHATSHLYKKIITDALCLNHLITKFKLGTEIDYISIDTEGNELEIIQKFNFKKYTVNFFTIEHNFNNAKRYQIYKIMKKNGFKRVFKFLSYMDDWYIGKQIYADK